MSFDLETLPEQIRDSVTVVDKGDRIEVQHGYIEDKQLFGEIYDVLVKQFGGRYFGYYAEAAHYEIPKKPEEDPELEKPSLIEEPNPIDDAFKPTTEEESEKEYDIKESLPKVGYLYPVLKDAHGHVIDGFHRLRHDPNWPIEKLDHITDPVQLAMARLVANACRRDVSAEEKAEWLRQIASMTSWNAKEIAENLPVNYTWVMRYLPDEFKDEVKAKAGAMGGRPSSAFTVKAKESQDTRHDYGDASEQAVTCECCSLSTFYPQDYEDKQVCRRCFKELTEGKRQLPTKPQAPPPKISKTVTKPPKTAQDIHDQMHPRVSKMEEAVLLALHEKGFHVESQKDFCVKSTRADFYLPQHNLAIFLDGEQVHKDPEKDQQLRELLTKRHKIQVLTLTYPSFTKTAQDQILADIITATEDS